MSNRILLGKNTNSNHGFSSSSPGYGLYVSRSSNHDVLTCTQDQLSFNTSATNTGNAASYIDVGLFQVMPASTNADGTVEAVAEINITAGSTITFNFSNLYASILAAFALFFANFNFGTSGSATASGSVTTTTTSTTSAQIVNSTSSSLSARRAVWNPISSNAFF